MKPTKHILLTIALLLCSITANAHDFEVGGIYYDITSSTDLTVEVTCQGIYPSDYNEYTGPITIPATVSYEEVEYCVTSIGSGAFSGCTSLTAITLPESVTSIGEYAFYHCTSLTAITLPESVTSIGYEAFAGCSSLTAITIPEGVTSIRSSAFYNCSSLYKVINYSDLDIQKGSTDNGSVAYYAQVVYQGGELTTIGDFQFYTSDGIHSLVNYIGKDTEIVLPDSYNGESYNIGDYAFSACSGLTAITIPEGVTSIGNSAFWGCSSLAAITIPEGVTSIGLWAFRECGSLNTVTLPASVTNIDVAAFEFCSSLTSITIPESVTSIENYTFNGCSSLTTINIPEGVTSIGEYAFYNCTSLTAITLPEGVTSIGNSAFCYCRNLTAINIPEGVTSIGQWAFWECSNLTSITIPEGVTSIGNDAFHGTAWYDNQPDGVIYVNNVLYGYKGEMPESTSFEVREGTVSISESAFYGCSSLTSITIPESVTSIGSSAFSYCSSLTAVHISSLEAWCNIDFSSYDANPLYYAKNLYINGELVTEFTIPNSVTAIKDYAFEYCSSLTAITIPGSVTSIGSYAFYDCSSLTTITIPENSQLTSIGSSAFYNCRSLTAITIPEGVTSIGSSAFSYCSSLTAVHISSIEAWCNIDFSSSDANPLYYAKNLYINGELVTEFTIPNSVTAIKDYAFFNCSSLTSITLPASVTSIGNDAFFNCSSLTSINIPEGVTSIGEYAFYNCSSLTAITIPEGVTSIGEYAFYNCSSLTAITIPEGVTSIGSSAFYNCRSLTSITCYAKTPPSCGSYVFGNVYKQTPVYVPATSKTKYWYAAEWKDFTNFQDIVAVTGIILSQSSVMLFEGETLQLTAEVAPESAFDLSLTWSSSDANVATVDASGKVMTLAAGVAIITATANDGSGVSASCEVTVKVKPEDKCAAPVIDYIDGQVVLTCETEGVTFKSSITADDARSYDEAIYALTGIYTITAQATKDGYLDSETVTATLCWVPCDENHGGETDIITIPAKPVLIQTDGGTITVNGLAEGTVVKVNDLNGVELGTAIAASGTATITTNLTAGSVAIVKIGERSVKVAIK